MAQVSVFYQQCPVCGRSLRIGVQLFGRMVTCVHCGGTFRSSDDSAAGQHDAHEAGRLTSLPLGFIPRCLSGADPK